MAKLSNSVGTNGVNEKHDVALVQLMLKLLKTSGGASYFKDPYTNPVSAETSSAITAFQKASGLTGGANTETSGLITKSGKTWKALLDAFSSVDARYHGVRTWKDVSVAYLPMSSHALEAGVNSVSKEKNLNDEFKLKVTKLMRYCYQVSEIAWTLVPGTGGWRAFEAQEGLSSNAGYGESIHAYGHAADISTRDLTWVESNGDLHTSAMSFTGMTETRKQEFLNARNAIAKTKEMGLFGTMLPGDFWHLQNYDDAKVDSVSSLMALLHQFGPKKMVWEPVYMTPTHYHCDLGLGGRTYFVGTAGDIWKMNPAKRISPADLVDALNAKKKKTPAFSIEQFFGRSEGERTGPLKESDIGEKELAAVQRMLKNEFEKAASEWRKWSPVYYPDEKRRPLNPSNPANRKKK